jgi:hypothetical protein
MLKKNHRRKNRDRWRGRGRSKGNTFEVANPFLEI